MYSRFLLIVLSCACVLVLGMVAFLLCQCPPGWLRPGDRFDIEVAPGRTISSITACWEDGGNNASGTLYIDGVSFGTAPVSDEPAAYTWEDIDYDTTESTCVRIGISGGCANIIDVLVVYEEAWTKLEPGDSIPLPDFPVEISRVYFDVMTDAGTVSEISLTLEGEIYISASVSSTPEHISWSVTPPEPAALMALKNTGSNAVYIRDLTTEY